MEKRYAIAIEGMLDALRDPKNEDLLAVVKNHAGLFDRDFEWYPDPKPAKLASMVRQLDTAFPLTGAIGVIYARSDEDIFADWFATRKGSALNRQQTDRFDAIVQKFDDGWSGAEYEIVMQYIRRALSQEAQS